MLRYSQRAFIYNKNELWLYKKNKIYTHLCIRKKIIMYVRQLIYTGHNFCQLHDIF